MRSKKSGVALIFSLAILAAVVAVLATAAAMQNLSITSSTNRVSQARAELAAESGIQTALSVLALQSPNVTTQNDPWFTFGNNGADNFQTDGGTYRIQIIDAGSLINLNSATQALLTNLPLQQNQIDSFLDWIQTGPTARTDGAKDSFYNSLPNPYNTREQPLTSLDELFLIDNFTPATLYTVQQGVNTTSLTTQTLGNESYQPVLYDLVTVDSKSSGNNAQGTALTNVNTATAANLTAMGIPQNLAQAIVNQRPAAGYTTLGAVLGVNGMTTGAATTVLNNLTVSTTATTGKVNLNTASQAVLQLLPGMSTQTAQAIVTQQTGTGFTTLGQVAQVPGMTLAVLRQVADFFTINSQAFIVRVIGKAGTASVALEAVITLNPTSTATGVVPPVSVTTIRHPDFDNVTAHWHWDNETSSDQDMRTTE